MKISQQPEFTGKRFLFLKWPWYFVLHYFDWIWISNQTSVIRTHSCWKEKKNQRDPSLTPIFQGYFIIQFDLNTFFLPSWQTPLICHRCTVSTNEKWKTETPSKPSPHNIKDSFCTLFLYANLPLNVPCTQGKKKKKKVILPHIRWQLPKH